MKPKNELFRIQALRSYQINGVESSVEFDDLTALAASICEAPMANINLIDEEEQWTKSVFGASDSIRRMPRSESVCQYTIHENVLFEVPDLTKDDRFKNLPYVKDKPFITYYLGAPLVDPSGNIIGVLCVLDYKPRKMSKKQKHQLKILARQVMAHFELKKQNAELHELNKHKLNLMKILSHDIRSPLGGIIGMSSLLMETTEFKDPETRQLLLLLSQSARQMNVMVNDILNYTIMDSKGFSLNLKETDLFYIIEHVEKLYKPTADLKKINLDFQIKNVARYLLLDPEKFEQILGNLISNAIKFTHEGGYVEIIFELDKNGQLLLTVRDNGIGMTNEMLSGLFKMDSSYERPGTTGEKSTGLGLSIIKHFTDLHNGTISVNSKPGSGTEFIIRFPITNESEANIL
ncbi:MAG: GAF domain-containing sensor histidine kinase [Balneolaceae bacterium]|nr:GAF domain-containing sensor histidine kinase [Balneolaceae bacterium]